MESERVVADKCSEVHSSSYLFSTKEMGKKLEKKKAF